MGVSAGVWGSLCGPRRLVQAGGGARTPPGTSPGRAAAPAARPPCPQPQPPRACVGWWGGRAGCCCSCAGSCGQWVASTGGRPCGRSGGGRQGRRRRRGSRLSLGTAARPGGPSSACQCVADHVAPGPGCCIGRGRGGRWRGWRRDDCARPARAIRRVAAPRRGRLSPPSASCAAAAAAAGTRVPRKNREVSYPRGRPQHPPGRLPCSRVRGRRSGRRRDARCAVRPPHDARRRSSQPRPPIVNPPAPPGSSSSSGQGRRAAAIAAAAAAAACRPGHHFCRRRLHRPDRVSA